MFAVSEQGTSQRHRGAGRVGERTAQGSGLGLEPAGSDPGAVDTTTEQSMVICTPFKGDKIMRARYSYINGVETVMWTIYGWPILYLEHTQKRDAVRWEHVINNACIPFFTKEIINGNKQTKLPLITEEGHCNVEKA